MVDGAWEGDPESKPCEMGGGPLVDYGTSIVSGNKQGGKTYTQAVKYALQIASGNVVSLVASDAEYARMRDYVEQLLRAAQVFPVAKYMKRFTHYKVSVRSKK